VPAIDSIPLDLRAAVERHWGFGSFRPLQERAIRAVLDGRDSLVVLPTGGGKSLCYQAPAIIRTGFTVVVSPLISLMKDQVDGLTRNGVPAVRLDSAQSMDERAGAVNAIRRGEARLVFTSPERLVNTDIHHLLRDAGAHTVAVDEAHCVSHWGHDFRPEYRQLARLREFFPGVSVHGYTATATERVRRDIVEQLGLNEPELIIGNFDRPNLTYRVLPRLDLLGQLRAVIDRHKGDAGIIYCLRRRDVDGVTAALKASGYRAMPYHAGLEACDRRATQDAFAAEKIDIVVATVAFGMGIDRSNVRYVIHAAMPKSVEHYQQETGRAGRDGLPSECLLLFSVSDVITFRTIIQKSAEEAGAPPEYLRATLGHLDEMSRYCRSATCRHRALVEYFGQHYEPPSCAACDQCLGDTQDVPDSTVIAQKILSCVARVKEGFGANHVVHILRGRMTQAIVSRGHDKLSTFGLLSESPRGQIQDWVYQLIGLGVLEQSQGEYPLLRLNAASWEVMKGKRAVRLVRLAGEAAGEGEGEGRPRRQPGALPEGADAGLFEELRALRRAEAARAEIQPYQVFHDNVLAELARGRPTTPEALRRVSGVGDYKLQSFGPAFLDAIREYCKRTGLAADVPMPKSFAKAEEPRIGSTSPGKSLAFELFRGGVSIQAVIEKTKMSPSTVTGYLTDFILAEKPASIFGWVPEDICERVAAAAEIHGTARLKPIFLELNEEIGYDQIRVVFAFLQSRS
jgi:ATP-dependent DNA helicase RecQ